MSGSNSGLPRPTWPARQGWTKELVDSRPDVIVASGSPPAIVLRQKTLSIPIVFVQISDPVATGLVTNLARPEGNITGFTNFEHSIGEKWLQTLKDCAPKLVRAAVVFESATQTWPSYLRAIEAAAAKMAIQLTPAGAGSAAEIEREIEAFAKLPNGGLVVLPAALTREHRKLIISLAAKHRLPAIYPYAFFAADGGLISYGADLLDQFQRTATYVDRILRGAKPADLPIQLPTKYEVVVNRKTAKALGLSIPQSVLLRADRVIE